MEKNPGVRKGTWTKEEDILLTKCIEKFGEGRWHQVPARAGLNRCRKSCRLRWLNYLRPNIKRGYFTKDEVDLLVRLHKLLGNRWSLIAGRLPGRTANDVKNFWNTYIGKKPQVTGESCRGKTITKSNIIRPRPWTFSRLQVPPWPSELPRTTNPNKENPKNNNTSLTALSSKHPATNDENPTNSLPSASASLSIEGANDWTSGDENHKNKQPSSSSEEVDECIRWWGNLLEMTENGEGTSFLFSGEDPGITTKTMFSQGSHDHGSNSTIQDGLCSLTLDDVLEFVHLNGGQ